MTIAFQCDFCQHLLRVPDAVAGKRIHCPQCREVLRIPAVAPQPGPPGSPEAVPADTEQPPAADRKLWQLKTRDGNTYGPVPRSELDQWLAEGRITGECQLKQSGHDWQWASAVYPELAAAAAAPAPPPDTPRVAEAVEAPVEPAAAARPAATGQLPGPFVADHPARAAPAGFPMRTYPAMVLTSRFYRILGWLVIFVAAFIACLWAVMVVAKAIGGQLSEFELAGYVGIQLLIGLGATLLVTSLVISLWFASDAIRCWMDIQDNTYRTMQYLERLSRTEQERP